MYDTDPNISCSSYFLDDPQVHGWQAFDKALVKGAVPSTPNSSGDGKKYYSRVAPPAARNTETWPRHLRGLRILSSATDIGTALRLVSAATE